MPAANRRTVLKLAAASTLALAAPALLRPAFARAKALTVASLLGDDKPETKVWLRIAELVEARLPGEFHFNIVRNGALGGEKEVAEAVRLGAVHASLATASALSGWVPDLQILDLPFLFRDAGHVRAVVDGELGEELRQKIAAQDFQVGGFVNYGARHLLTKEPVTRPEEMSGKKIRVIQSALHTDLWKAFGCVPVGIPITETYNALSTGVADAMDLTTSAYAGFKLYEVVPCLTRTGHIWASGVVYYAASFWRQLAPEQQAVFLEASREGADYFNRLIVEDETVSQEQALAHGGQVVEPADIEAWRARGQTIWERYAPALGGLERLKSLARA